jgi:hypothetical protein
LPIRHDTSSKVSHINKLYVIMKEETQKNPIKYEYLIGFDNYNGESNPEICNSKRQDKNKIDYTGLVARAYSRK